MIHGNKHDSVYLYSELIDMTYLLFSLPFFSYIACFTVFEIISSTIFRFNQREATRRNPFGPKIIDNAMIHVDEHGSVYLYSESQRGCEYSVSVLPLRAQNTRALFGGAEWNFVCFFTVLWRGSLDLSSCLVYLRFELLLILFLFSTFSRK